MGLWPEGNLTKVTKLQAQISLLPFLPWKAWGSHREGACWERFTANITRYGLTSWNTMSLEFFTLSSRSSYAILMGPFLTRRDPTSLSRHFLPNCYDRDRSVEPRNFIHFLWFDFLKKFNVHQWLIEDISEQSSGVSWGWKYSRSPGFWSRWRWQEIRHHVLFPSGTVRRTQRFRV